jgi:hypothetical protein
VKQVLGVALRDGQFLDVARGALPRVPHMSSHPHVPVGADPGLVVTTTIRRGVRDDCCAL